MKHLLFDTCVIIAGNVQDHPHHSQALPWLKANHSKKIKGFISTHAIAELYATLTKSIGPASLSGTAATDFLSRHVLPHFETIALSAHDYKEALVRAARTNRKGGAIYDALHVQVALKKELDGIITFNMHDFRELAGKEVAVVNPFETRA